MRLNLLPALLAALGFVSTGALAQADTDAEIRDLRKEVEELRKGLAEKEKTAQPAPAAAVDAQINRKFGPNAVVTTKEGKLTMGGLLEIWNYTVQQDNYDAFGNLGNDAVTCSGYRIRRSEFRFKLDVNDNITACIMLDPAREATSFPGVPSNQGLFKSWPANTNFSVLLPYTADQRVSDGAGLPGRMLQDAYLNFHDIVPHHDFQIGQFLPPVGEEGIRDNAYLDFGERAMITQQNQTYDLGVQVHGSWLDKQVQYHLGVFDGAGNFFGTAGDPTKAQLGTFDSANRSDDNSNKDFAGRLAVRPIWEHGVWGNLELGYSLQCGKHGGLGDSSAPINGINREAAFARREAAWVFYKPMGPVEGWWMRGEWGLQHDRTTPFSVQEFGLNSGPYGSQLNPTPFTRQGWYASTGYKLNESYFAERLSGPGFWNYLMQPVEFVFRYETFQNIVTEDPAAPDTRTNLYKTSVVTAGVNYYVNSYSMRVQVNGMLVSEPLQGWTYGELRNVKNNVLLFTYQILF